jgi:hypothetical protein
LFLWPEIEIEVSFVKLNEIKVETMWKVQRLVEMIWLKTEFGCPRIINKNK